jgi:hypothetical protein
MALGAERDADVDRPLEQVEQIRLRHEPQESTRCAKNALGGSSGFEYGS